jgi:hypothetical protein
MRKAPLAMRRGQVDVVIARHDGHFGSTRDLVEQRSRLLVLVFQRQVGDVAGDHEVIRLLGSGRKHGKQVLAAMYAASVQNEVRITRQPLVEDDAAPFGGRPRKDVQVGDVRDANHTNQRLRTCRHLLDAARQRVTGTVCRA